MNRFTLNPFSYIENAWTNKTSTLLYKYIKTLNKTEHYWNLIYEAVITMQFASCWGNITKQASKKYRQKQKNFALKRSTNQSNMYSALHSRVIVVTGRSVQWSGNCTLIKQAPDFPSDLLLYFNLRLFLSQNVIKKLQISAGNRTLYTYLKGQLQPKS